MLLFFRFSYRFVTRLAWSRMRHASIKQQILLCAASAPQAAARWSVTKFFIDAMDVDYFTRPWSRFHRSAFIDLWPPNIRHEAMMQPRSFMPPSHFDSLGGVSNTHDAPFSRFQITLAASRLRRSFVSFGTSRAHYGHRRARLDYAHGPDA